MKVGRLVAIALALTGLLLPASEGSSTAATSPYAAPVHDAPCGPGSHPESEQGRVSAADIASGRAAQGYSCNTTQIAHLAMSGGFRVEKYQDKAGHLCGYFDSTLIVGRDLLQQAQTGLGVYVVDMTNPAHPVLTATLTTPAMLSPHESLRVNAKRGLLAADMGNPATAPGFVDVYDLTADCRKPVLQSSTPLGILGHESGFSPDGRTFYVSSAFGHSIDAIDLTNPRVPVLLWVTFAYVPHGLTVSDDGNRLYVANDGAIEYDPGGSGLLILDVSQVQARRVNPVVKEVSRLTWPEVSIPQIAIPMTIHGHRYLAEVDEFTSATVHPTTTVPMVGAARIIDIQDEKKPFVVSNLRLAVNNLAYRGGSIDQDPGQENIGQGYTAHYCSIPQEVDPQIMACSYILSGLRVFDIHDPAHPKEIGYFNPPVLPGTKSGTPLTREGSYAMSSPGYDLARHEIWYSDSNHGFYVVKLSAPPVRTQRVAQRHVPAPAPAAGHGGLAATGLNPWAAALGASCLLGVALIRRRATRHVRVSR